MRRRQSYQKNIFIAPALAMTTLVLIGPLAAVPLCLAG